MISRTAERVLAIIAAVLTGIGLIGTVFLAIFFNMGMKDPEVVEQIRLQMIQEGGLSADEWDMFTSFFGTFSILIWIGAAIALISLILNIVGLVKLRNHLSARTPGVLFIAAGLFAGILSLPSILLYIAGIICFTKKAPMAPEPPADEITAQQSSWMN